MYNPLAVANYFIYKSIDEGVSITPMKVLKLVYIAHGWHLGIRKEPLITEQTEAWKYGPVVESVYVAFKKYGRNDIDAMQFFSKKDKSEFNELLANFNDRALLDKVWEVYRNYTGTELSALTHMPDTPWFTTWNKEGGSLKSGAIIPNAAIRSYYEKKAQTSSEELVNS